MIFEELEVQVIGPVAICVIKNSCWKFHDRASEFEYTMLINGRYQCVRECLERGDIHVENERTDEQVAV